MRGASESGRRLMEKFLNSRTRRIGRSTRNNGLGGHRWWMVLWVVWVFPLVPDACGAQEGVTAEVTDFVAPITDDQGKKTVIRGKTGRLLKGAVMDLSGVSVEIYKGTEKDLIVEAEQCLYDPQIREAWSSGKLTVSSADGGVSVKGVGFRWTGADSRLTISNAVQTVLRKSRLDPRTLAGGRLDGEEPTVGGRVTEPPAGAERTIEILASGLNLAGNRAVFTGAVQARDLDRTLNCKSLTVEFGESGGGLRRIVAQDAVRFADAKIQTGSQEAIYSVRDEVVTLSGDATWKAFNREGTGDSVVVDLGRSQLRVLGGVSVKLPAESFGSLGWLETSNGPNAPESGERSVVIRSRELEQKSGSAVFKGPVIVELGGQPVIHCDVLEGDFSEQNGEITGLRARGDVRFEQGETSVVGDQFDYGGPGKAMVVRGSPRWKSAEGSGSADLLVLDPKNQRIQADGNVAVEFAAGEDRWPELGIGSFGSVSGLPATGKAPLIHVSAGKMYYRRGSVIFLNQVHANLSEGVDRQLMCSVLALFFGADGQGVEQLTAEDGVELRQPGVEARGGRVTHDVAKGVTVLSGNPTIQMGERRYRADEFRLDRTEGRLHMKGDYRIEVDAGELDDRVGAKVGNPGGGL
jgi:lipopolysaccharide export system protein LptA